MANTPQNDDFPTIRLDDEDRRDYQQKKQSGQKPSAGSPINDVQPTIKSKSGFPVTATLSLLIALGASGAAYYLYDLNLKQQLLVDNSQARILELERRLSATGEEIGESTVALQVKVTELTERTTELWDQMDKLWASAWRRNQKEIADLSARVSTVQSNLQESISQVARNTNGQQTKIAALETQITNSESQLSNVTDELLALNVQLEQSLGRQSSAVQENKNLQEQLAIIEQRNVALSGRITQIENEIKALATKMISQTNTPTASTPSTTSPASL